MPAPSVFDYVNEPDAAAASLKGTAIQDALRRDQRFSALAALIGDPALGAFSKDVGGQAHDMSKELTAAAHQRAVTGIQQQQYERQATRDDATAGYQARMADAAERRAAVMEERLGLTGREQVKTTDLYGNTTMRPKYAKGPGGLTVPQAGGAPPPPPAQGPGAGPTAPPAPGGAQPPPAPPQGAPGAPGPGSQMTPIQARAAEIMAGRQPPPKGRELSTKLGYALSGELAKHGFDLSKASLEYTAAERFAAAAQGPQQLRLRQAVTAVRKQLDNVKEAYAGWQKAGGANGIRVMNRGALAAAKQLGGDAGAAATVLEQQIALLHGELGTAMMGGGSPTDHSLHLAQSMLGSDWDEKAFSGGLSNLEKDLQVREYAMTHVLPATMGGNDNRYAGGAPAAPGAQARTVARRGKDAQGHRVVQYSDGSIEPEGQ